MQFSRFGQKLGTQTGIVTLMDDLGEALRVNPDMIFMGGGNPARIPAMEQVFAQALATVLDDPQQAHQLLGVYQPPQGDGEVLDLLASVLRRDYGWSITRDNIALANGSQSAFFVLFNLFSGEFADGSHKRIHLPLTPEYLGYSDQGIQGDTFSATRPAIEELPGGLFKYHVDFANLNLGPDTGALCVSRPTNPTGNVISDAELAQLAQLARAQDIPLIVDGAYGTPFPNIVFTDASPAWDEQMILVLSLSKLGLPGVRTGIVIARPELIQAFARANTILNLANGNLGPALLRQLLLDEQLLSLSRQQVAPFYRQRMEAALASFQRHLQGLPVRIHKPEGAIFLWLWFQGLPITSQALYEQLKVRGVLVVSGHHFFPGLEDEWQHRHECIRVTYCQDPAKVEEGARIIGEVVREVYAARVVSGAGWV